MRFPFEFTEVPPPEWVDDVPTAEGVLQYFTENSQLPPAVDTETTGLRRHKDTVVLWSISDGRRRFVLTPNTLGVFREFLRTAPDISMHNANFDRSILANSGVDIVSGCRVGRVCDTMVQHHWIDQGVSHKLEDIAEHDLGLYKVSFKETFGAAKGEAPLIDPDKLGDESYRKVAAHYASWDAYLTALLRMRNDLLLKEYNLYDIYHQIERPFMDAVYVMERSGILVDRALLESYIPIYKQLLDDIQEEFNRLAGRPINMRSTKQLRDFFYGTLKKPVTKETEGSEDSESPLGSTDASVLEGWAAEGDKFAKLLLDFRTYDKQYSTYAMGILERLSSRNMLFTEFNLHVAATGRLSSSGPNLQNVVKDKNIPSELRKRGISFRKVFIPEPGYVFLDADYSQVEMIIGAYLSRDKELIEAVTSGLDTHCLTVSRFFNIPYERVVAIKKKADDGKQLSDEESKILSYRDVAKTINFGVFYGMGPGLLAKRTGVSFEQAKRYISLFFTLYPGVKRYVEEMEKQVLTRGYVMTVLGRRRVIRGAHSLDPEVSSTAKREAVNTPVQGSAADVLRNPMIQIAFDKDLIKEGVKMRLQVHDELLLSIPEDAPDSTVKRIVDIMEHPFEEELGVPLRVEARKGKNWAEAK